MGWVGSLCGAILWASLCDANNALESVVDYRVQLQRNVDEEGGKYTEAKPRCTCPLFESTLRQSRLSTPPLLCDFRLVHWRTSSLYFTGLYSSLLIVTPSCIWPRQDKPYSKYRKKISTERDLCSLLGSFVMLTFTFSIWWRWRLSWRNRTWLARLRAWT